MRSIICVCESSPASIDSVGEAIEERQALHGAHVALKLSVVPAGYVAGQESALVNHLNGGPAIPRSRRRCPSSRACAGARR